MLTMDMGDVKTEVAILRETGQGNTPQAARARQALFAYETAKTEGIPDREAALKARAALQGVEAR